MPERHRSRGKSCGQGDTKALPAGDSPVRYSSYLNLLSGSRPLGLSAAAARRALSSAAAHAFHCRGPRVSLLAWKLDFAGIACLLGARAALEGYLLLYCRRDLLAVWTAVASITFGGFGFAAVYFYVPDALAPLFVLLHAPLAAFAVTEWPALPRSARADARASFRPISFRPTSAPTASIRWC